ncbi:nucleophile aminohydrolase [Hyaloraphidium curvatum]|nr:nucleophile aminohydrolase [Hyaloraphidium curvatum]
MAPNFILVHAGAGTHPPSTLASHLTALRAACLAALPAPDALEACLRAVCSMEDDEATNAGRGSNLSMRGTAECDASVMAGSGEFGGVAAAEGIANPVRAAAALLRAGEGGTMPDGVRAAPLVVCGRGAWEMAKNAGVGVCSRKRARDEGGEEEPDPGGLATEKAERSWKRSMRSYLGLLAAQGHANGTGNGEPNRGRAEDAPDNGADDDGRPSDTVGAISHVSGRLCAASSSGGPALKVPGRVGHAALFGCGAWASDPGGGRDGAAASTSGRGEQIVRTSLAREMAAAMLRAGSAGEDEEGPWESIPRAFGEAFLRSPFIQASVPEGDREAGLVLARVPADGRPAELWWCHSTPSMVVGYYAEGMAAPVVKHSVRAPGQRVACGGWSVG